MHTVSPFNFLTPSRRRLIPLLPLSLASMAASLALVGGSAQASGLTRQQVLAELVNAQEQGDLFNAGEFGQAKRDGSSSKDAARPGSPAITRAQVRAELATAVASGDLLSPGDGSQTLREQTPSAFPSRPPVPSLTRQRVLAELEAARRSGDLPASGESGLKLRELRPDLYPAQQSAMSAGPGSRPGA